MRVILDTNVLLDILQNRMPWAKDAIAIFRAVAGNKIEGCITAKQIADLHFFARKMFKDEENVDAKARQVIAKRMGLFEVIDTLGIDCRTALGIGNADYEDAILIAAAVRENVDCIITRNTEHFSDSSVPVYLPDAFASTLTSSLSKEDD